MYEALKAQKAWAARSEDHTEAFACGEEAIVVVTEGSSVPRATGRPNGR
jgi:hypothetical protein